QAGRAGARRCRASGPGRILSAARRRTEHRSVPPRAGRDGDGRRPSRHPGRRHSRRLGRRRRIATRAAGQRGQAAANRDEGAASDTGRNRRLGATALRMIPRFFIDRPIFANVIAIVTVIFGLVTLSSLPVEQYPQITPPTVQVSTTYPGADARVVCNTVATPIEEQVNGVEGMLYMSSTCSNDGSYGLVVTFDIGTNLNIAQVLVQNRDALAEAQLPDDVKRQGITVKKQSTQIILFVVLTSPADRY